MYQFVHWPPRHLNKMLPNFKSRHSFLLRDVWRTAPPYYNTLPIQVVVGGGCFCWNVGSYFCSRTSWGKGLSGSIAFIFYIGNIHLVSCQTNLSLWPSVLQRTPLLVRPVAQIFGTCILPGMSLFCFSFPPSPLCLLSFLEGMVISSVLLFNLYKI